MRTLAGSLVLLGVCLPLAAGDADQKRRVKVTAQAMGDALLKEDFVKFADYMHPNLLKLAGGRAKLLEALKAGLEVVKAKGFEIRSFQVGEPTGLAGKGGERFAIVPSTTVMAAPGGKITVRSFLVGASDDAGKTWTFIEGAKADAKTIRELLPNFPEDLKLPAQEAPVVEKTGGSR